MLVSKKEQVNVFMVTTDEMQQVTCQFIENIRDVPTLFDTKT